MNQTLTIRSATAADLPAVLRLYQQPDLDDGKVLPMEQAIALWHKMQQYPDYRLIVAQWDDGIVGTFTLLVMDNLLHLGAPAAVVEAIAVDPQFHNRGIGGQMMRWAMAEASRAGCYKLVLSSNQKRIQAHAFYENLGFQRHGYSFYIPLPLSADGSSEGPVALPDGSLASTARRPTEPK
ncbi:MAG: GNAT family N-acetyltransferase [Leptolyngbyaceae cyanobacterium]